MSSTTENTSLHGNKSVINAMVYVVDITFWFTGVKYVLYIWLCSKIRIIRHYTDSDNMYMSIGFGSDLSASNSYNLSESFQIFATRKWFFMKICGTIPVPPFAVLRIYLYYTCITKIELYEEQLVKVNIEVYNLISSLKPYHPTIQITPYYWTCSFVCHFKSTESIHSCIL